MAEVKSWPAWFYGPEYDHSKSADENREDGTCGIFESPQEVPKDWTDTPAKNGKKADPKTAPAKKKKSKKKPKTLEDLDVSRQEAIAYLEQRGVDVAVNISEEKLVERVEAEIKAEDAEDDDSK